MLINNQTNNMVKFYCVIITVEIDKEIRDRDSDENAYSIAELFKNKEQAERYLFKYMDEYIDGLRNDELVNFDIHKDEQYTQICTDFLQKYFVHDEYGMYEGIKYNLNFEDFEVIYSRLSTGLVVEKRWRYEIKPFDLIEIIQKKVSF